MMIPSFEIKNYRAFRHLKIGNLGNVNLIVGKNNIGKTSLLEAMRIYANNGAMDVIRDILDLRDENRSSSPDTILSGLSSIFHGRNQPSDHTRNNLKSELGIDISTDEKVSLSLTHFTETTGERGQIIRTPIEESDAFTSDLAFLIQTDSRSMLYPIDRLDSIFRGRLLREKEEKIIPCTFVPSRGTMGDEVSKWWDNITLTAFEEDVLSALRVIHSEVSRISVIASKNSNNHRVFMVKTTNLDSPIPLKSLGEGMVRIIEIALAMVNAPHGIVLIDEIENGIHFSVQSDMWRLIFDISERLGVQVFATSHSWDCIEAFQSEAVKNIGEGRLLRLENHGKNITATIFNEDELSIISRDRIEVR